MAKKKKYKHGGPHDPNLAKVKKGLKYVESSNGLQMTNPKSSATGFYGQLYGAEELQYMPYLQGIDRQSFASDTTLQNRLFEDRYYGNIPKVPGLKGNAEDLRIEYQPQLAKKGIPFNYTDDEISALSNLLGRQGTREYLGYVLRDGRSLADVFPKIYGPDPEAPNKTPEKYLESYRKGRDLKYGGQVRSYGNGGPTDPPTGLAATYDLQPAMDYNINRLNNPFFQNRLRKEYSNAHGIDLTDQQMSDLISGGIDMINTGGNTATYTEEGMANTSSRAAGFMRGDYSFNPLLGKIPSPVLGQISLRPGLDEDATKSVAKHEVGHRYNAALGTPFSSSTHSPLIDQSIAYNQSFFNKPYTQGAYRIENTEEGEIGSNRSRYYRSPHEIKSYKLQLEDEMQNQGVWNPMKSEFDQSNLRSLLGNEKVLSGSTTNVMTQGLGLNSLAEAYKDVDPDGFNANPFRGGAPAVSFEGNKFRDAQVPLLDSKGIPLNSGVTASRDVIGKKSVGSNVRDTHTILGGSKANPLTPNNAYEKNPDEYLYEGYSNLESNPYSSRSLGDFSVRNQKKNRGYASDIVKGSNKNFRNLFNKGMSYKDMKDDYFANAGNVVGLTQDINSLTGSESGNAYWNNEIKNNPEVQAAYERMSGINAETLDKYNVNYKEQQGEVRRVNPMVNVSDQLSKRKYKKAVKQNARNIADFIKTGYKEQTGSSYKKDEKILMDAYSNVMKGYQQSSYRDMPALEGEIKDSYNKRKEFQGENWMDFIPDVDGVPAKDIGENAIQFMNEVAMEDQSYNMAKYGGNMKKYKNGGDPPKKKPAQLQFDPTSMFNPYGDPTYSLEEYNTAITRDSTNLEEALSPGLIAQMFGMDEAILPSDYADKLGRKLLTNRVNRNILKPYSEKELQDINYRKYGGKAMFGGNPTSSVSPMIDKILQASMEAMIPNNIKNNSESFNYSDLRNVMPALHSSDRMENGGKSMDVDYEAEGGEVVIGNIAVNKAYNGGIARQYKGSNMFKLEGPSHANGGIGITMQTGGKAGMNYMRMGGDNETSYVFSDAIGKKGNTFADRASKFGNKLDNINTMAMGGEISDRNTAERMGPRVMSEVRNLFNEQEDFKVKNNIDQDPNKMIVGGLAAKFAATALGKLGAGAGLTPGLTAAQFLPGAVNVAKGLVGTGAEMNLERVVPEMQEYEDFTGLQDTYMNQQDRSLYGLRKGLEGSGATGSQIRGNLQAGLSSSQNNAGQFFSQVGQMQSQSNRQTDNINYQRGIQADQMNSQMDAMEDQFAMQNDPTQAFSQGLSQLIGTGTGMAKEGFNRKMMEQMFGIMGGGNSPTSNSPTFTPNSGYMGESPGLGLDTNLFGRFGGRMSRSKRLK